ncbi:MAG: dephospho-CoA kinase, partial [Acidimicrobiaceae bacterium]|nr:dephospho-CoA kinase [Acidimicrobiaceae bacterium]
RARIASQADRESRLEVADFVINNDGTVEELEPQIDACYRWASALA